MRSLCSSDKNELKWIKQICINKTNIPLTILSLHKSIAATTSVKITVINIMLNAKLTHLVCVLTNHSYSDLISD